MAQPACRIMIPEKQRSCAVDRDTQDRNTYLGISDMMAAFLDISLAYDNVVYDILIEKLEKINCPKKIIYK